MLIRMYMRWAERHGYGFEVMDHTPGEQAGSRSLTASISGDHAYGRLRGERGVHRLVRLSPYDSAHRRHTSFASVDVIPEVAEADEIEIKAGRSENRNLPRDRRGRAAREQDGLGRTHYAHSDGHYGGLPE